MAIGEQDQIIT